MRVKKWQVGKLVLHMEHITWGWHPVYHILMTPFLFSVLPPFPWMHNKNEASTIVMTISKMKKENSL
jgi:hypothetical protein